MFINQNDQVQNQELHLFQFPLRPANRPYGDQGELVKVECLERRDDQNVSGEAAKNE